MSADFTPVKEDYKILTPFKMQVLTNFPYIEADFDALTNYQLLCKVVEYLNNVITNENEVTEQVNSLYNAFVLLQNYVNHYFDTLDLQSEVDVKLDEMAESGALADMIADYIKLKGLLVYNSVAEMKEADNIVNGSFCKTYGYYGYNDGGGAYYKVRTVTNEDNPNNMNIIALANETLVAEYIPNVYINADQFGAKGDGETDDYNVLQYVLDYSISNNLLVELSKKEYYVSESLTIDGSDITYGNIKLIINGNNATIKGDFNDYIIKANIQPTQNFIIENLELNGNLISSGLLIYKINRYSIKNIIFHYCYKGLTIINSWYGNVDNNCMFDSCLHSINLEEDPNDTYYGENNTIDFGNLSIDAHNVLPSAFNSTDLYSTGIIVEGLVHTIKFVGTVVENVDIGISGGKTLRGAYTGLQGNIMFDKCYFEDNSVAVIDWIGTSTNCVITNVIFINNNLHPAGTLKAKLNYSRFYIQNNSTMLIEPYVDNRNLTLLTDLNDYYISTNNYNYSTRVIKLDNTITRSTTMDYTNPSEAKTYPVYMNLCNQDDDYIMYSFLLNGNNVNTKNAKAYSINSKNLSFDKQTLNPVGLIINGTNNKKYMLSTNDGSTINLIEMNNPSRIYERINGHDAYWLYANRNSLPDGYKSYCYDLGVNVKLIKNGSSVEWWTDESNSYICIGTSISLYDNLSNQPSLYWRPCWDLSFNRGVLLHGDKYLLGFDWAMNNDPRNTQTQIRVYGTLAERPATPTYDSIYYATDENKYYKYENNEWTEVTKIM